MFGAVKGGTVIDYRKTELELATIKITTTIRETEHNGQDMHGKIKTRYNGTRKRTPLEGVEKTWKN